MDHTLPPSDEILNAELARLYKRRLIVVELIQNLERYAECEAGPRIGVIGNIEAALLTSQLSSL
jgi:hypothetical protein